MKSSIDYKGFRLVINHDFEAGDPGVHTYPNGDPGYPPTGDDLEINSIMLNGVDIYDLVEDQIEEITEALLVQLRNLNG